MAAVALSDRFDCEEVYFKKLTENDMRESSRLYVKKSPARRICPQAFVSPSNESEHVVSLLDADLTPLPIVFHRRDNKGYLTGRGWSAFVEEKKLSQGDILTILEYTCKRGTGERFFMIGSKLLFGRLIG